MYQYGFVLGGGAARGLAHVGIMKAMYEKGILPDVIAGTSMGAIVGSLLAIGMTPEEIEEEVKKVKVLSMVDFSISRAGIFPGDKIFDFLKKYLGAVTFEHLKIPLRVCAVDIENGELVTFKTGKVLPAVRASMSIPGIFLPYKFKNRLLVDGGLIENLPIDALDGFECVHKIAVSVRRSNNIPVLYRDYLQSEKKFLSSFEYPRYKLILDIVKKSYDIAMGNQERRMIEKHPDVTLLVPQMDEFDYADFLKKDEIIDAGYKEGKRLVRGVFGKK